MEKENINSGKKWLLGINSSKSPIEIGYFEEVKDIMHIHERVNEYYLVFSGNMTVGIEGKEYYFSAGDVIYIEPKEKHEVLRGSKDLRCFLIKWPHLPSDKKILRK